VTVAAVYLPSSTALTGHQAVVTLDDALPAEAQEILEAAARHRVEGLTVLVRPVDAAPADVLAHAHHQFTAERMLPDEGADLAVTFHHYPEDLPLRRRGRRIGRAEADFWFHVHLLYEPSRLQERDRVAGRPE
jgi:hypothetical protein